MKSCQVGSTFMVCVLITRNAMEYFYMLNHESCRLVQAAMSRFTGHLEPTLWLLMARPPITTLICSMQKSESFLFDLYAFTQSLRALILTNALLCDTKPNFNLILSDDSSYFLFKCDSKWRVGEPVIPVLALCKHEHIHRVLTLYKLLVL